MKYNARYWVRTNGLAVNMPPATELIEHPRLTTILKTCVSI